MPPKTDKLLSYWYLFDFVERPSNSFTRTHATILWNTITTNLLIAGESYFNVFDANNNPISLSWYKEWLSKTYFPRNRIVNERRRWKVTHSFLRQFKNCADPLTPSQISDYGPVARRLLAEWLEA
jgi:hypothetical protein